MAERLRPFQMPCRISVMDTVGDAVQKLAEGMEGGHNAGALSVLCVLGERYQPKASMTMLYFDAYGIYADKIYEAFNDHCGRDFKVLIRRTQRVTDPEFAETVLGVAGKAPG